VGFEERKSLMIGELAAVEDATEIWAMEACSWLKLNTWSMNEKNRVLQKSLMLVETVSFVVSLLLFYWSREWV